MGGGEETRATIFNYGSFAPVLRPMTCRNTQQRSVQKCEGHLHVTASTQTCTSISG